MHLLLSGDSCCCGHKAGAAESLQLICKRSSVLRVDVQALLGPVDWTKLVQQDQHVWAGYQTGKRAAVFWRLLDIRPRTRLGCNGRWDALVHVCSLQAVLHCSFGLLTADTDKRHQSRQAQLSFQPERTHLSVACAHDLTSG